MVGKLFPARFLETKETKRTTKQEADKTVRQFRQFPTIVLETTWTTWDNFFEVRRPNRAAHMESRRGPDGFGEDSVLFGFGIDKDMGIGMMPLDGGSPPPKYGINQGTPVDR